MKNETFLLTLFLVVFSLQGQAREYGCQIHPRDLAVIGTQMAQDYSARREAIPDSVLVNTDFNSSFHLSEAQSRQELYGSIEGFYRPDRSDFFSILPLPLFGVDLRRDKNVIYACAHVDRDPKKTHVTVYLMEGYRLEPTGIGNFFRNMMSEPKLQVAPLRVVLLSVQEVRRFLFFLNWIPVFDWGLDTIQGVQTILASALGSFSGIGIERIVITMEGLEIASGVNLNSPDQARIIKKIPWKQDRSH